MGSDNKPQETDFLNSKFTRLYCVIEAYFPEWLQNPAYMPLMLLLGCQVDEYVIEVAYHEFINVWP